MARNPPLRCNDAPGIGIGIACTVLVHCRILLRRSNCVISALATIGTVPPPQKVTSRARGCGSDPAVSNSPIKDAECSGMGCRRGICWLVDLILYPQTDELTSDFPFPPEFTLDAISRFPDSLLRAELQRRNGNFIRASDNDDGSSCGSGQRGTYNTPLHVMALFLILILSTFGTYHLLLALICPARETR